MEKSELVNRLLDIGSAIECTESNTEEDSLRHKASGVLKQFLDEQDCSIELLTYLGDNVETITHHNDREEWEVTYKSGARRDLIPEDDFLDFLKHA